MYLDQQEFNGQYLYSIKLEGKTMYSGDTYYRCVCCGRRVKDGKISCAVKTDLDAGTHNILYFPTYAQAMEFADKFVDTYPKFKFKHISKYPVKRFFVSQLISVNTTCGAAYVSASLVRTGIKYFTDVILDDVTKEEIFNLSKHTMQMEYLAADSAEVILSDPVTDTPDHLMDYLKNNFNSIKEPILEGNVMDNIIKFNFKHDLYPDLYNFTVTVAYSYPHLRFAAYTDQEFDLAVEFKKCLQKLFDKAFMNKDLYKKDTDYYKEDDPEYNKLDPEDYNLEDWD